MTEEQNKLAGRSADPEFEHEAPETQGTWQERCAALYQVVGCMAHMFGVFESSDDVSDALDVAAGRGDVEKLLPWPKVDLCKLADREPATEAVLEMALTRMDRAREILRGPNANWGMLDTSDLRAALKGKGASQGADMSGLDYDALWHKAKEEARRRAEAMYPPEASHDRAITEIEIAQRLYRQFTMPPKEMP